MACESISEKLAEARLMGFVFAMCLMLVGCGYSTVPDIDSAERYPAGDGSVGFKPLARFDRPLANMPLEEKSAFYAGRALAVQPWVKAPTATDARDGLGPLYNARACLACHVNGGKGSVPITEGQPVSTAIVRLSIPGKNLQQGVLAEPVYGDQLQTQSVSLAHQLRHLPSASNLTDEPAAEAVVYLKWSAQSFTYPDRQQITLRKPALDIRSLGYGSLHSQTLSSLRLAPAIHGAGLLEAINQADIDALADADDANKDGISGRVNRVWDAATKTNRAGRFGHKATRPDLAMTVAAAFANDIGISNPLFPQQPCTSAQIVCAQLPDGNNSEGLELPQALLDLVVNFNRNLAVPKRRQASAPLTLKGRALFYQSGCATCHQPRFVTADKAALPHLSKQIIWPYSDLLLHDMGPGLADDRPDFAASGSEWRTPPLWGLGLSQAVNGSGQLLHDGRAQTVEEAIIWHGGEASEAQQAFAALNRIERSQLIKFVESL